MEAMQGRGSKKQALKAWAKASAICIVASPAILCIWELIESSNSKPVGSATAQIGLFLAVAGIAAGVHFLTFILIGIPIFLHFYSRPQSVLWRWFPGVLVGTVIGITAVPLVLSVIYSRPLSKDLIQSALAGGLYGGVTALASLVNRPNVEQAGATCKQSAAN